MAHHRNRNRNHERNQGNERNDDFDLESEARYDRRARGRERNADEQAVKSVKIEAPTCDGRIDLRAYSDWESDMDHYFKWYDMSEERRIWFAKMKLVSQARLYWSDVEHRLHQRREEPIGTWDEMKEHLRVKYLPQSYHDRLLDQRSNLQQVVCLWLTISYYAQIRHGYGKGTP